MRVKVSNRKRASEHEQNKDYSGIKLICLYFDIGQDIQEDGRIGESHFQTLCHEEENGERVAWTWTLCQPF